MVVNYLITGVAGFVGSELAITLAKLGCRVVGVDRAQPHIETVDDFAALGVEYVRLDLLNKEKLAPLLNDIDIVIHAAGVSRVSEARAKPQDCVSSTVLATTNLLELMALQAQADHKPLFIYLSTREVSFYDRLDDAQVNIDHIYAISKKAAEQLILAFSNSFDMPSAICRLSDVYGGKRDHVNKLLPTYVKRAKQNEMVRVLDNETRFHFTHIRDVIDSILEIVGLLRQPGHEQKCFQIWSDESYTAEELAALVVSTFNSTSKIDFAVPATCQNHKTSDFSYREWQFTPRFRLIEELIRLSDV